MKIPFKCPCVHCCLARLGVAFFAGCVITGGLFLADYGIGYAALSALLALSFVGTVILSQSLD